MTPRQNPRGFVSPPAFALLPWATALAVVAFLLGAHLGRPVELAALGAPGSGDTDHDGIGDALEGIMGLNPDSADSDRDDWSDSEELARGSDPKDSSDVPTGSEIDVSVKGYSEDGVFHLVVTVFTKGGLMTGHQFQLGVVYQGVPYLIPPAAYLPVTEVRSVHARLLTDRIHVLDIRLPERLILELRNLSFFATAIPAGEIGPTDADVMNLTVSQGVPFQVVQLPVSGTGDAVAGPTIGARSGTFYTPLVPLSNLPQGSATGKICVQDTRVTGVGGAGTQMQVESASCEDGDGSCSASCDSTIGTTFDVLDPLTLIGG
jgi:hypothetical protein